MGRSMSAVAKVRERVGSGVETGARIGGKVGAGVRGADKLTGGAVVARILAAEGVDRVFGIIDGTYFGMYSAFAGQGIRLVSPRHETAAAHMAGAYARLTGKVGVCMASNGPGVANVLPGVAVENAEGNRVLLITSCRRTGISYPDRGGTFQCFPQVEVTAPMTKWSVAVPSVDRVERDEHGRRAGRRRPLVPGAAAVPRRAAAGAVGRAARGGGGPVGGRRSADDPRGLRRRARRAGRVRRPG